jgi:hypothetical protein
MGNSRGSDRLMAPGHNHILYNGRIYTHPACHSDNNSAGENHYGAQDRIKITSGLNQYLKGGLKWNK